MECPPPPLYFLTFFMVGEHFVRPGSVGYNLVWKGLTVQTGLCDCLEDRPPSKWCRFFFFTAAPHLVPLIQNAMRLSRWSSVYVVRFSCQARAQAVNDGGTRLMTAHFLNHSSSSANDRPCDFVIGLFYPVTVEEHSFCFVLFCYFKGCASLLERHSKRNICR